MVDCPRQTGVLYTVVHEHCDFMVAFKLYWDLHKE